MRHIASRSGTLTMQLLSLGLLVLLSLFTMPAAAQPFPPAAPPTDPIRLTGHPLRASEIHTLTGGGAPQGTVVGAVGVEITRHAHGSGHRFGEAVGVPFVKVDSVVKARIKHERLNEAVDAVIAAQEEK